MEEAFSRRFEHVPLPGRSQWQPPILLACASPCRHIPTTKQGRPAKNKLCPPYSPFFRSGLRSATPTSSDTLNRRGLISTPPPHERLAISVEPDSAFSFGRWRAEFLNYSPQMRVAYHLGEKMVRTLLCTRRYRTTPKTQTNQTNPSPDPKANQTES